MADYRDNVVSSLIPICLQTDQSASLLSSLLPVISHHQLFGLQKSGSLNDVIGYINSHLNSSRKRLQGLVLLDCMIQQCSAEIFSSHCQTWLSLLLQALQCHASDQVRKLSLSVLSSGVERVTSFPELCREVGTTFIGQLLPVLLSVPSQVRNEAIACIATCIVHFPGPCGHFQSKIRNMVLQQLDKPSPCEAAVRCYILLARCGNAGTQGAKHRDGWTNMCDSLLSSFNFWLGRLYEGLETGEEQHSDKVFTDCQLPSTQPQQSVRIVHRFQALCRCLEVLIRESFTTWIYLPVDKILRCICRTLAVHINMLACKTTTSYLLLLSYLPAMHVAVLKVLSQLIVCCKRLLLPQASLVLRLAIQCLTTTQRDVVPGLERPFRELREAAYDTLRLWLQITGGGGLTASKDGQEELVKEICRDILPQQGTVRIEVRTQPDGAGKAISMKKKKKGGGGYQELTQASSSQRHSPGAANASLATTALNTLHVLVGYCGTRLPADVFKVIQNVRKCNVHRRLCKVDFSYLLVLGFNFDKVTKTKSIQQMVVFVVRSVHQNLPPPYASGTCRQAVYQVLLSLACLPYPRVPSLLQIAIALFQQGLQDYDHQVVCVCQEALMRCEGLVHPRAASVCGPVINSISNLDIGNAIHQPAVKIVPSEPSPVTGTQSSRGSRSVSTSADGNAEPHFTSRSMAPDSSSSASPMQHDISVFANQEPENHAVASCSSSDLQKCSNTGAGRKRKLTESDSDSDSPSSTDKPRFDLDSITKSSCKHDSSHDNDQSKDTTFEADTNQNTSKGRKFLQEVMLCDKEEAGTARTTVGRIESAGSSGDDPVATQTFLTSDAVPTCPDSLPKHGTAVETILMTFVDIDQELD